MKGIARPDIKPAFAERNIPVALAVDENYLPYAAVTINSLVSNTKSGNLDVFLLHAGISETAKADFFKGVRTCENLSLRFVDIGDAVKESAAGRFIQKNYLTVTALFRLFIPKVFVAYEKLVYLDVDLVVCEDLSELYERTHSCYKMSEVVCMESVIVYRAGKAARIILRRDDLSYF